MSAEKEIKRYLEPVLSWIGRHLNDPKMTKEEKKKLVLLREFVREQLPHENSRSTTR